MIEALERFEERWLSRLNSGARATFKHKPMRDGIALHSAIADGFVTGLGMEAIGFNWELLDASSDASGPRAALTQIAQALANDIANPNKAWLGEEDAVQCARDFLDAFDPAMRTVLSNRYDGLWNPISGASVEWGFVAFDEAHIALLLIADT